MAGLKILADILADMFGAETERDFSEGNEITFAKKIPGSRLRALGQVNFSFRQTAEEFSGRQVNQFKFGLVEH